MYSSFYHYFNIQADESYTQYTNSSKLIHFLLNELNLVQDGVDHFRESNNQPWMSLAILVADKNGCYCTKDVCPKNINLIAIVGSKKDTNRSDYVNLLVKIAKFLEWELMEESNEDADEDIIIWSPSL